MDDKKKIDQTEDDIQESKKGLIAWINEHRSHFLVAGISITTIITAVLCIRNKKVLLELFNTLKKEVEPPVCSAKWFKSANVETLQRVREEVQQDFLNPKLDMDYRSKCWDLLPKFDIAIGDRLNDGKEHAYYIPREHGWNLYKAD